MLRIKEARKRKRITAKELADHVSVAESTMSLYENGKREPDFETLLKISDYLGVTVDYLLGKAETNSNSANTTKKGVRVPVYGNVAAGIPIEAITDIEDYEEIPEEMARGGEYIALKIHGDSMEPRMQEGDVVIVHLQETIENGEIAVVSINRTETTCKKVKKTPDGIMLLSINPSYDPMYYSNKEIEELPITILGKVVELRAKF